MVCSVDLHSGYAIISSLWSWNLKRYINALSLLISSSRWRHSCHPLWKSAFKQWTSCCCTDPIECRGVSLYRRHDWSHQYHVSSSIQFSKANPLTFGTNCSTFIDFRQNKTLAKTVICSRLLFLAGVAVLITGGCLQGSDSSSDLKTGTKLVRIGYGLVAVFVACLLSFQLFFWLRKSKLSHTSCMVRILLPLRASETNINAGFISRYSATRPWPCLSLLCAWPTLFFRYTAKIRHGTHWPARLPRSLWWPCWWSTAS